MFNVDYDITTQLLLEVNNYDNTHCEYTRPDSTINSLE